MKYLYFRIFDDHTEDIGSTSGVHILSWDVVVVDKRDEGWQKGEKYDCCGTEELCI